MQITIDFQGDIPESVEAAQKEVTLAGKMLGLETVTPGFDNPNSIDPQAFRKFTLIFANHYAGRDTYPYVKAIKAIRELLGLSLTDAKIYVDTWFPELGQVAQTGGVSTTNG